MPTVPAYLTDGLPPFARRHIGPSPGEQHQMLQVLGCDTFDDLVGQTIPDAIRHGAPLELPPALTEPAALAKLRSYADQNRVMRSYIGMGYHDTITPPVVLRNVVENPGWYTAYTPYQAEISQGRMEALLVYQTVVQELTGMEIANASLLDEATAAAEAMTMSHRVAKRKQGNRFLVDANIHPQTLAVVRTRAEPLNIAVEVCDVAAMELDSSVFGILVSYPGSDGSLVDWEDVCTRAHAVKAMVTCATDLLALCLLRSPGTFGADIAIGNSQRFGVPLGFGGPHAGFMATKIKYQRQLPGRVIGISKDAHGAPALRMALQTREQHIRRERATSNICTSQVLLAVVAGMYAVWHGPEGLTQIAATVHNHARCLAGGLRAAGFDVGDSFFDTVRIHTGNQTDALLAGAVARGFNLRRLDDDTLCVSLDETTVSDDVTELLEVFEAAPDDSANEAIEVALRRLDPFLQEPVFHRHRSETAMLRWLHTLEVRDLALNTAMIPLGSCTMKLNATTEMIPVTWDGFSRIHPFAPKDQTTGYRALIADLEAWLGEITGFDAVSLQPNAGSQGEYAGLLTIRAYHEARGQGSQRNICLIPRSAHGTNPASAVLAGMKVVVVECDDQGNIDVADLRAQAEKHGDAVAALMVTYPSTHGVFETSIIEVCEIVHGQGGQVYMDGANMNAMLGLCRPADFGADVCHLNLHKTFAIPHGGGGPGVGPIGVKAHLAPFLPAHSVVDMEGPGDAKTRQGAVSAAPWGSPGVLPITWAYIAMLGPEGLRRSSEVAILSANYIAKRLEGHYDVLYKGEQGRVAHECILDTRPFKADGVVVDDLAKRLMDYGFHAPTMSFPVVGTLMVEPTESEPLQEVERFIDAMLAIREEIRAIASGESDPEDNALKHSPHTLGTVCADTWEHGYSRAQAAFPTQWLRSHKYWPTVGRIDNAFGDRNLICSCDAWPSDS